MGDDVRFKSQGLAPKSAADFAFLLHSFHFLKDEGVMAIILPHGVLFRGGAEERTRLDDEPPWKARWQGGRWRMG
jgi:type I restriction enzyme M protein